MDSFEILESLDMDLQTKESFYKDEDGELKMCSTYYLINKCIKRDNFFESKIDELTICNSITSFSNLDMIAFAEYCLERDGNVGDLLLQFIKTEPTINEY